MGCGTGVLPDLLDKKIDSELKLSSDLLDVSDYCLNQCSSVLNKLKHFQANQGFLSYTETIETAIPKSNYYDSIWAIHSFYTVDINKIQDILKHIKTLIKPSGIFLMCKASSDSWYNQLYNFYLKKYEQPNNYRRFITAEDIQENLELLELQYDVIDFDYNHEIDCEDRDLLEAYLKQCILNNYVDVLSLFKEKLLQYLNPKTNQFSFKQKTKLIIVKKH
nr:class I SAM-dependent methyltransferase [Moorena sp. SIO1F2]